MSALFSLYDWDPPAVARLQDLLHDLFEAERTTDVKVNIRQAGAASRTYSRSNSIRRSPIVSSEFSIIASSDKDRSCRAGVVFPWVSGQFQISRNRRLFSFFSEYATVEQIETIIVDSRVFKFVTNGYGYICEAKSIIAPDYYAAGVDVLTPGDLNRSAGQFLNGETPTARWGKCFSMKEKPYLHGKFRDVYSFNVINKEHVAALEELDFSRWWGVTLWAMNSELFAMSVHPGAILEVRSILDRAGLLLAKN